MLAGLRNNDDAELVSFRTALTELQSLRTQADAALQRALQLTTALPAAPEPAAAAAEGANNDAGEAP